MLAVARAMIPQEATTETIMLIHMGASNTNVAVISKGTPMLSHAVETGGSGLSRALAQELNMEFPYVKTCLKPTSTLMLIIIPLTYTASTQPKSPLSKGDLGGCP